MPKNDKMHEILELLQNLFILEAVKAKMPSDEIRKILRIDKKRINAISKHVKS
jgi:hypothetical protein